MYNRSSRPARNRERSRLLGEAFPDGRRMAEDEETEFPAQLIAPIISNAELDRLIVDLGTNPLAKGELRQVRQGIYVSLSQSQPDLDFAFCLSSGGRMYFCFRKAAEHST
jgi:hypothetical protein